MAFEVHEKNDKSWYMRAFVLSLIVAIAGYIFEVEWLPILALIFSVLVLLARRRYIEEQDFILDAMKHPEDWLDANLSDEILSTETCWKIVEKHSDESGVRRIWYVDYRSSEFLHAKQDLEIQIYDLKIRDGIGNALLMRNNYECILVRVLARPQLLKDKG